MFLAQRLEISERIDRGVLTEGQGQIEGTRLFQQAIAQIQERQRSAMANVQAVAQANAVAAAQARAAAGQEQAARSAATTNALLGASAFFAEMGGRPGCPTARTSCRITLSPATAMARRRRAFKVLSLFASLLPRVTL
jgi:hypothetical protein